MPVIFVRSGACQIPQPIATIALVQQSSTLISQPAGTSFSPSTAGLTGVAAGNLLLSIGGWWDGNANTGGTTPAPTNSNGTFVRAGSAAPVNPDNVTPPGWPVNSQICQILSAAAGTHTVTPPDIFTNGGDGYFLVTEWGAPGKTWSRVDSGNGFNGSITSGAVDGCTATTDGAAAQVGDLVVCACAVDGNPTSVRVPTPSGYRVLYDMGANTSVNAGMGASYKLATSAGAQSAVWVWADNDCNVARAAIAVYRAS